MTYSLHPYFPDYPQRDEISPEVDTAGPAIQAEKNVASPQHISPAAAKPQNISLKPFLPGRPASLRPLLRILSALQLGLAVAFGLMWLFFGFPVGRWWYPFSNPWLVWMFRSMFIGGMGAAAVTGLSLVGRKLEKEVDRVRADMHRERGEKFAPPTPESAEWLNAFTRTIWGIINPEMFVPIVDMVEGKSGVFYFIVTRIISLPVQISCR
jgi:hypothetical protein